MCQEHESPVETRNYATFIAERLGLEYEDKTRKYTRAAQRGDYDAIVEDARPVFEANGLTEEEARRIIEANYPSPTGA